MNNTLKINDNLKVRIGLFIQIPVPNVFDQYLSEEEIQEFSLNFSSILKKQYEIENILFIRATNNIKGKDIVACLIELSWMDSAYKLYKLNLLWFQEGYAFPVNPDVEKLIQELRFDLHGTAEDTPF